MRYRVHHDLIVRQETIELVKGVYRLTSRLPQEEVCGVVLQMRRAAVRISSNVAKKAGRAGGAELEGFLNIVPGSLGELDTQMVLARELGFTGTCGRVEARIARMFSLLGGLVRAKK